MLKIYNRSELLEKCDRLETEKIDCTIKLHVTRKELFYANCEILALKDQIADLIEQRDQAIECIKARQ